MPHPLNTNRQFMIGNGLLAFAVIGVVVVFTFLSLHLRPRNGAGHGGADVYTFAFAPSLAGDSLTLYLNDSLLGRYPGGAGDSLRLQAGSSSGQQTLFVVDEATDRLSLFPLEAGSGTYVLEKEKGRLRLRPARR